MSVRDEEGERERERSCRIKHIPAKILKIVVIYPCDILRLKACE